MKKSLIVISVVALVLCVASVSQASSLFNLGFETGDLTGWTSSGNASVVTSHAGTSSTYNPVSGSYFAQIMGGTENVYYTLTQAFTATSGETIGGWAAFDYGDYHSFNDYAKVEIKDASGVLLATPWSVFGNDIPNYTDGPWTQWNWVAPSDGTYALVYGSANNLDGALSSYGLFDAGPVIPEPASMMLLGTGLFGLIGLRKKKK